MEEPDKVNYNAFIDDVSEIDNKKNQALKINNKKSRYSKEESKKPTTEEFERAISNHNSNEVDLKEKIAELSLKYKSCVLDKTLTENKGPVKKSLEQEVIRELVNLGLTLNNDQSQPEGVGSVGLLNLLMQIILVQRDSINKLGFFVSELERRLDNEGK